MTERSETHPADGLAELIENLNFSEAIRRWRSHMNFKRKCTYWCEHHDREVTEIFCGHCLENMLRTKGFKDSIASGVNSAYSDSSQQLHQWLSSQPRD